MDDNSQPDSAIPPPIRPQAFDRFVAWPLCIALGTPLLFSVVGAFFGPLILLLAPLAIALALTIVATALLTIRHLRMRRWRRAISMMILPGYVAFALLTPRVALSPLLWFGVWARFAMEKSEYDAEIAALPPGKPRYKFFFWSGFAGNDTFVIYDETDATALAPELRPKDLSSEENVCDLPAIRITGHYYFC